MIKNHEGKGQDAPVATVTLTLQLSPALSTEEIGQFGEKALANGETLPARVARLIREDLSGPADPEPRRGGGGGGNHPLRKLLKSA